MRAGLRFEDGYRYRTGGWEVGLPSTRALDLNVSYPVRESLTISLTGTNVLDERRIHILGGSVIQRRMLATLSWRP